LTFSVIIVGFPPLSCLQQEIVQRLLFFFTTKPFFFNTSDTELPTSSLDWDFTVSNMFKIPSPPARKKASKVTSHRLLTTDEMFEQKIDSLAS
jgi:hypothetical protein